MIGIKEDTHISVRIDAKTKQLAQVQLAKRGLSLSAYIKMMLTDIAENQRVLYPPGGSTVGGGNKQSQNLN